MSIMLYNEIESTSVGSLYFFWVLFPQLYLEITITTITREIDYTKRVINITQNFPDHNKKEIMRKPKKI